MASVADLVEPFVTGEGASAVVHARATELREAGAVRLDTFGPLRVTAAVDDGGVCRVELSSSAGSLQCRCACDGDSACDPCVHVLAAAMEMWHRSTRRRT
jgi:hypothetical protein